MPDKQNNKSPDVDLEQAHAPEEFKPEIDKLLKRNKDLLFVTIKTWAGLILFRCISIRERMSP